jgi:hypothetical protein
MTVVGTRGRPARSGQARTTRRVAASVAAVKEPTGVLAQLAAVEAGDVEVAEARDGSAKMREQHAGHPAKRGGLVPPEHTGVAVAGILDLDGEGAIALADRHSGHAGGLVEGGRSLRGVDGVRPSPEVPRERLPTRPYPALSE